MQHFEFSLKNHIGFHEFLMKESLTDTVLICEKRMIKCHKLLLAASSQYFYELFSMIENNNSTIALKDITLNQLMKILEYIYCGKVSISENELNDFKHASEYFQMNINFGNIPNYDNHNNSIPEFMSQETTAENLTMDSFRLSDSQDDENLLDTTFTGQKDEPHLKKIKITESFGMITMRPKNHLESETLFRSPGINEADRRKRNYFEFSENQKKKVAFEIFKDQSYCSSFKDFKPKKSSNTSQSRC